MISPRFLSVREVAERLHLSTSSVYQLIETKKLAHHRIGPNQGVIRVSEADLALYLATCREGQAPPKQNEHRPIRTTLKHLKLR